MMNKKRTKAILYWTQAYDPREYNAVEYRQEGIWRLEDRIFMFDEEKNEWWELDKIVIEKNT